MKLVGGCGHTANEVDIMSFDAWSCTPSRVSFEKELAVMVVLRMGLCPIQW